MVDSWGSAPSFSGSPFPFPSSSLVDSSSVTGVGSVTSPSSFFSSFLSSSLAGLTTASSLVSSVSGVAGSVSGLTASVSGLTASVSGVAGSASGVSSEMPNFSAYFGI